MVLQPRPVKEKALGFNGAVFTTVGLNNGSLKLTITVVGDGEDALDICGSVVALGPVNAPPLGTVPKVPLTPDESTLPVGLLTLKV